ncbi:RNA methyltransferase [Xylaria telfairii]|nr:RNA methyltransferase [Xylaria telfairii]
MRFPTSSCLLCRHSVLLRTLNTPGAAAIPYRPASSLSAIHHGLRESEKSRPQGFRRSSLEAARPRRPSQSSGRSRDPDWTPPTFKIKRGKKDVTDTGPGRQSRRSRFNDPESSFGKRSLVYQMKHGALRESMAKLQRQGRSDETSSTRRAPGGRLSSSDFMRDFQASTGRPTESTKGGRREPAHVRRSAEQALHSRSAVGSRNFDKERTTRAGTDIFTPGTPRKSLDKASSFRNRDEFSGNKPSESSRPRGEAFNNTSSFGNRHEFSRNKPGESGRPRREAFDNASSFGNRHEFSRNKPGESGRPRREAFDNASSFGNRPESGRPRREAFDNASSFGNRPESSRPRRESFADTSSPRNRPEFLRDRFDELGRARNDKGEDSRREPESRRDDSPIRVHHTTAASQFLYGRSVVEAALKDSRRQLYKLYIYSGDDRRNVSQDEALAKLAGQKAVEVTKVTNDGLRMMDKMSGGRPHNGCVLEASPLPQLPLKALGSLSEDPKKPGFHLELAHQSSEQAKINGTSEFVSYQLPKGRNPFILLLDGILDPGNLGAILRTAAFLGVNGIAITQGSSTTLTPVALKASAGASEVMTLFSVNSAVDFVTRSKENGWLVYAAVPLTKWSKGNSHLTIDRIETYDPLSSQPTVLVIGSEGEGLAKPVRRQADHEVSIPSPSGGFSKVVDSLNVSVATGILCAAFLKKQTSGMIEIAEDPVGAEEDVSQLW